MVNYKDAVTDVLNRWQQTVGEALKVEATHDKHEGLIVSTWYVTTQDRKEYVLKNAAGRNDDQASIISEIRVLQHLHDCGVPVAVPIQTDSGQYLIESAEGTFLLYPVLPVDDENVLFIDEALVYTNIGKALAKLHGAMASYPEEIDSWTMNLPKTIIEEAVPQIEGALSDEELENFQQAWQDFKPTLNYALADLPTQYIHGDCHGGNYLLCQGDVSGFIDLDHMPHGPRCYDIAYVLADFAKAPLFGSKHHHNWLDNFTHVIAGYEWVQKLTETERAAMWPMMLAIQLMFAYWLFKYDSHEAANKNMESFYWLYENRATINAKVLDNTLKDVNPS